jgi:hypothetical protein
MLIKYELVNVPPWGVDHFVGDRRYSITDRLTDQQAELLINAGLQKYFRLKPTNDHGDEKSPTSGTTANPAARKRDARGRFTKA